MARQRRLVERHVARLMAIPSERSEATFQHPASEQRDRLLSVTSLTISILSATMRFAIFYEGGMTSIVP